MAEHLLCAFRPKIAPDFCAFCQGLSAVVLAQVNFTKNKQIKKAQSLA
nr:MAG TPA_asm: hypothetical protein [Caudoviricetes sp.]